MKLNVGDLENEDSRKHVDTTLFVNEALATHVSERASASSGTDGHSSDEKEQRRTSLEKINIGSPNG